MKKFIILMFLGIFATLLAQSHETPEPMVLFKNLERSLQQKDRSIFEKEVMITLDDYLQYYSEKRPLLEKEKQSYQERYHRQKNIMMRSWDDLLQFLANENLSFKEAEYLGYGIFRQDKQASYTPGYRINHVDYDIKLSNCFLVDGAWKLASGMQIKKREPYEPVFKKANMTWGNIVNPDGKIPANTFKRIYFNIKTKQILQTDVVKTPFMDITQDIDCATRYKITTEEFAGYFVGKVDFKTTVQKNIVVRSSDLANVRVIIDGKIVCENKCHDVAYTFEKGRHTIEIEYLNSINFLVGRRSMLCWLIFMRITQKKRCSISFKSLSRHLLNYGI
ncbi:MAG: hypothetical protein PHR87_07795 [Sulfurospirillaceae bacterium]|nr:hypothetical protein [Sulfurospirillaceae bacterium]